MLIAGAVLILPFLVSPFTMDPALLPRFLFCSALTFLLILVLSVHLVLKPISMNTRIIRGFLFIPLVCFLGVSFVSLTRSINPIEGLFECLKGFLAVAFCYVTCVLLCHSENGTLRLTQAMILTGTSLALIGICQHIDLAFTGIPGHHNGIYATMVNKNLLASALFLSLPFTLYGIHRLSGAWRFVSGAAALLIFMALIMTRARAVWLGMVVSAALTLPIAAFIHKKKPSQNAAETSSSKRVSRGLRFGVPIIVILLVWAVLSSEQKTSIPLFSSASLSERALLWGKTLDMVKDHPFLGVGPGQWRIVLPRYGEIEKRVSSEGMVEILPQRPHNDYLWVLSETGSLGLFFYLSFFGVTAVYSLRVIFHSDNTDHRILALLMLFGLWGYMVIAFFSFPRERITHTVFLMFIVCSILVTYHQTFPIRKRIHPALFLLTNTLMLIGLGVCIIVGYGRLQAEGHARKAISAYRAGAWEQVIVLLDHADLRVYPLDPTSTPLSWYRGMAHFSLGHRVEALEDFKRACLAHPYHIHSINNIGTLYALNGDTENAIKAYRRALTLSHGFQDALENLDLLLARQVMGREPAETYD
ncbi:MAG: O-antigen ligase family protein [Deltaproteobacteria bacterium]|nr:O-antigen ligase family protein [Deltaproteobacteria bacterium]